MAKLTIRTLHKTLAPIVLLPLFTTVFTGVSYRLAKDWFGLTRDQVHILMVIHEGEYFGKSFESFYVLLNGLGLLWMLITGLTMLINHWRKQWRMKAKSANS